LKTLDEIQSFGQILGTVRRYERAVGEVFGEGKNRRRGCGFGFGEGKFDLLWRELLGKILAREKNSAVVVVENRSDEAAGRTWGTSDEAATWLVRRICLGLWAPPPCA